MPALIPGYEYDIFISYRHNDNLPASQVGTDGWVSEFVQNLEKELRSTVKDTITIYFDKNPHDGLLETHHVDKSLKGKLKCVIFIPILSQTYCDTKSFAWQHEFCVFNKQSKEDSIGRDIRLANGNVTSRILPIKIHDLDANDRATIENEIGGVLRAIDFIYKEAGVNRPLKAKDDRHENLNNTDYGNQINKVANAVKELIAGIQLANEVPRKGEPIHLSTPKPPRKISAWMAVILLLLGLSSFGYFYFGRSGSMLSSSIDRSIAVLPFVNLSNEPDQEYFSDGMTDEVLNRLFRIGDLRVISRTSSMKFKGVKLTAKEIAGQLDVANILEGSVQKAGNRLKITVQLIDGHTDNHLWSETYERELNDVFLIQSEIAQAVAGELRIKLNTATEKTLREIPTSSQLAYDYYLKANESSIYSESENAINLFSKALEVDSLFAEARYKRINMHLIRFWFKNEDKEKLDKHLALAESDIQFLKVHHAESPQYERAVALHLYWVNRKYEEALKIYEDLLKENPGDDEAREFVANILRRQGHWKESIEQYEQCLKRDPLSTDFIFQLAQTYTSTRQPEKAVKILKFGRSVSPDEEILKFGLMFALLNMGTVTDEALRESGFTNDNWASTMGIDFTNKSNMTHLAKRRKEGGVVNSGQISYLPITFDYARIYFLDQNNSLAKIYADSAVAFLLKRLEKMAGDQRVVASLGICYALAGNERQAILHAKKAIDLLPITLDAFNGPDYERNLAEIYIIFKKYDLALDKIEMLLSTPNFLSIGWMMADPMYEPIRNLPRFKKLAEKYKLESGG